MPNMYNYGGAGYQGGNRANLGNRNPMSNSFAALQGQYQAPQPVQGQPYMPPRFAGPMGGPGGQYGGGRFGGGRGRSGYGGQPHMRQMPMPPRFSGGGRMPLPNEVFDPGWDIERAGGGGLSQQYPGLSPYNTGGQPPQLRGIGQQPNMAQALTGQMPQPNMGGPVNPWQPQGRGFGGAQRGMRGGRFS